MFRKTLSLLPALVALFLLAGLQGASNAQLMPGQILAKGSIKAPDGVSTVSFYISAQWKYTGVVYGSQFTMFTSGPGLPAISVSGTVTSVVLDAPKDAIVTGNATVNGQLTTVVFHVNVGAGLGSATLYGCMAVCLTGGVNFQTTNYPYEWPISVGGVMIRAPYP